MDYEKLKNLVEEERSAEDIGVILNCCRATVQKYCKKYGLKLKAFGGKFHREKMSVIQSKREIEKRNGVAKYNYADMQNYYNQGYSWYEVAEKFNTKACTCWNAVSKNILKSRSKEEMKIYNSKRQKGKKISQEAKNKLSIARKAYLSRNGHSGWKTHDKFKSQPCEWLKTELKNKNYKFEEEFQPLLHKQRFFSMDIAFTEAKFAIEINGGQHYDTNGELKPYYQDRHNLIKAEGWEIWEVKYHETRSPLFLEKVIEVLNNHSIVPMEVESITARL